MANKTNHRQHAATSGRDIGVYLSVCDAAAQFPMWEEMISVHKQHELAEKALRLGIKMGLPMNRCIARPYVLGKDGKCERNDNRHDAVLAPAGSTLINVLRDLQVQTCSVGKINDLVKGPYHYNATLRVDGPSFIDPCLDMRFVHPNDKDTNPANIQAIINALMCAQTIYTPAVLPFSPT